MATSLAEQLQNLAVPQTASLKRDKKRASLLFDPREAATLTRETVYQIGTEGFRELKKKNPYFVPFGKTLFHASSKDFERSVQSTEANENLNKNIKHFLQLLQSYFTLDCSHKAFEWLVYRYHIHEYNKDDVIMLILPHHETNIFVRVLQLMKIRNKERWAWLKPLQKPGVHLTRETLFTHAANTPSFLQFFSDNLLSAVKDCGDSHNLSLLFKFHCVLFSGAIKYSRELTDTQITYIIPSVIKGLKSSMTDFCLSALGITPTLLMNTTMSHKLLNRLIESLAEVIREDMLQGVLITMTVLYQTQKHFLEIPPKAIRTLAVKPYIIESLHQLSEEGYSIENLLVPLLTGTLTLSMQENDFEVCRKFMNLLLMGFTLDGNMVCILLRLILDKYSLDPPCSDATKVWLAKILVDIEKLDPLAFDKEVAAIMKKSSGKEATKRQIAFRCIIGKGNSPNDIESQTLLCEQLYHPSADIRKAAVKSLLNHQKTAKGFGYDSILNTLIEKLEDTDGQVIKETLDVSNKIMKNEVPNAKFRSVLIGILRRGRTEADLKMINSALKMLCRFPLSSDVEVLVAVLPFLLPVNANAMHSAEILVDAQYLKTVGNLLKPIVAEMGSYEKLFKSVYKVVRHSQNEIELRALTKVVTLLPKEDTLCLFLSVMLLCNNPKNNRLETLNVIFDVVKSNKLKYAKKGTDVNYVQMAANNKMPLQGILGCIDALILGTELSPVPLGDIDFNSGTDDCNFILLLLDFLLKGVFNAKLSISKAYAETMKTFFVHFCNDNESKIRFLLNVSITTSDRAKPSLQLRSLRTVHAILSNESTISHQFIESITPNLIAALSSKHAEIRKVVLETLGILLPHCAAKNIPSLAHLIRELVSSTQELLMDREQTPLVVFNALQGKESKSADYCVNALLRVCDSSAAGYLKSGVMRALSLVKTNEVFSRLSAICSNILLGHNLGTQNSVMISVCIAQFDAQSAPHVNLESPTWTFIKSCLSDDKSEIQQETGDKACPAMLLMAQIDRELYDRLSPEVQNAVLDIVIRMATNSQNPELLSVAGRIFKHIDLDACSILEQLTKMRDVLSPKLDVTKRKRRISVVPTLDILDTKEWKEGVTVLEFLQDKKKTRNADKLLPILFDVLKKCLDFDEQASVEYPKQLVLSAILHYCDRIDEPDLPKNAFNVELIVQCVRASQNPQTHHHALLLLSRVASFGPNQVLHHIMAIFTFMGSSVLRHDDAYSFQIIAKIIETIVPILIEGGDRKSMVVVLRVFVDVILDVPEHRRLPLYKKLLEQVGVTNNLYLFLLLVFQAHVVHPSAGKQSGDVPKRLDVATELCGQFSPEEIISSCIKLVEYLKQLPDDKEDAVVDDPVFKFQQHTPKQFRHYKYTLVTFASGMLGSKELVRRVASLSDDDAAQMETLFKNMIINILTYIQSTTKIAEKNANTPQSQYWKVLLHHAYDILDSLNALLTSQMFLLVVKGLMTHTLKTVKRRALELLNSKLQHDPEFFKECDERELYAMLPSLINIIKCVEEDLDTDQEVVVQTALLSLKLFVRLLAPENPDKFLQILHYVTDIVKSGRIDVNIKASAILCLSELCSNLGPHAIPCLDKFVPSLIKAFKHQKPEESPTLLLLSALTALQKILDCLSLFLSPYLEKLLCELSSLGLLWNGENDDPKIAPFVAKLTNIKQKIGGNIPLRVLLPAINSSFDTLILKKKYQSVKSLMDILAESLSGVKGAELQNNMADMTALFLNALQFRTKNSDECTDCNEVEAHIIKALTCLILKLSENTFRPLYYKLYDWAIRGSSKSERVITFYALSGEVAASLKGLFVLFAGHFIQNAAAILDECNATKKDTLYFDDEDKTILLLENVLKTLNLVCVHDGQKFLNKERFDLLMQPIADQLDNRLGDFETRARTHVIPCIVNLAVAVGDDSLWKQLNYQILLKMRDASVAVRLIGLECLHRVAKKLGEDFLPLLPETIPFLAELLEDEDETVEKACRKVVQELETVLGEPLQKYF